MRMCMFQRAEQFLVKAYNFSVVKALWMWPLIVCRVSLCVSPLMGLPGVRFGWFGLRCARALRKQGNLIQWYSYSTTPVSCVRYFEYSFALRHFKHMRPSFCLDLSSPRLFSSYVMNLSRDIAVDVVNPDMSDLQLTRNLMHNLGISSDRARFLQAYAESLPFDAASFDMIWSISVIEHIPSPNVWKALDELWRVLRLKGVLILTVTVSRKYWDEFREESVYRLKSEQVDERGVFFQRHYDAMKLKSDLLSRFSGGRVIDSAIYGERRSGWFTSYEKMWQKKGNHFTCWDPLRMQFAFRPYASIDAMPGDGIICLAVKKEGT